MVFDKWNLVCSLSEVWGALPIWTDGPQNCNNTVVTLAFPWHLLPFRVLGPNPRLSLTTFVLCNRELLPS